MGRRGDDFGGALNRRASRDRFDIGRPIVGSVYPTKGKGLGVQGEAQYLDVLDRWDKEARWQSWRKGMALAHSGLIGAAERFTLMEVDHRDAYSLTPKWITDKVLLAGFTSRHSPEGRWTVALLPRGSEISPKPVGSDQKEFWHEPPPELKLPRRRLLELTFKAASPKLGSLGLAINSALIGEVIEDSAISAGVIEPDAAASIGLLCVAVREDIGKAYFDAERYWTRYRTGDGRLVTQEIKVDHRDPLPMFRRDHHLTQAMRLSCNCPSHCGLVFTRLLPGAKLGTQGFYPQRSPGGLHAKFEGAFEPDPEGVRRRFHNLPWDRIPGHECKHCAAVRFALGAPMEEPNDMPSLMSDYWLSLRAMGRIEEIDAPMSSERFLEQLRLSLLSEEAFSRLDMVLLAAAIGDCLGVVPQRVEPAPIGVAPPSAAVTGVDRQNEQHAGINPLEDSAAVFGDWWVPPARSVVRGFEGPGVIRSSEAVRPLNAPDQIPALIP